MSFHRFYNFNLLKIGRLHIYFSKKELSFEWIDMAKVRK